jgi:hypothetical protein
MTSLPVDFTGALAVILSITQKDQWLRPEKEAAALLRAKLFLYGDEAQKIGDVDAH